MTEEQLSQGPGHVVHVELGVTFAPLRGGEMRVPRPSATPRKRSSWKSCRETGSEGRSIGSPT
ncbi:hypothetical protein [Rhodococcus marinonascens]|uniref:hypothetical protein n=1 Tax=Rhodococcus marinonascens TaxID=38311 RepID=UPI000933C40B|nr:hypothetical protein [Rhodococcus marinonascens]